MANPNCTLYDGPPLHGPGLIYAASIPKPPLLESTFNTWYQTVHIPDILAAKPGRAGCVAAWRFKCRDSTRPKPYLALYSVPDMAFISSKEFKGISQWSDLLPDGGPSQRVVDLDTRFYRRVQVFMKPGTGGAEGEVGVGKVIKCTAIQPALGTESEFDRWYREEHLEQVSHLPGWRKSTRFELVFQVRSLDDPQSEQAPKFLAIHEFEEGTLVQRMPREEWTEWTVKMVESAVRIDEGVFEYVWGMGDEGADL